MSAPQTQSETKSQASWKSIITYGLIAWAVSTTIWFACRAYTTVFEQASVRGVKGVLPLFICAVIVGAPAFAIMRLSGRKRATMKLFVSALLVGVLLVGEGLASIATGKPISWDAALVVALGFAAIFPWI